MGYSLAARYITKFVWNVVVKPMPTWFEFQFPTSNLNLSMLEGMVISGSGSVGSGWICLTCILLWVFFVVLLACRGITCRCCISKLSENDLISPSFYLPFKVIWRASSLPSFPGQKLGTNLGGWQGWQLVIMLVILSMELSYFNSGHPFDGGKA